MRFHSKLMLAVSMSILALGPIACTGSSWCADCEQATTILGLNYQPTNLYTVGTPIPVNPPNPAGGTPRIYEVTAGSLPAGLSLDPTTGRITGTPTAPGVYTLTIRGSNSANSASQTIQITVVPALPLALSYATPLVFPAATAIAAQLPTLAQATPGVPTTYAITSGTLPAGLTLNADGTITGTPTTPGVYPFTVTASNGTRSAAASATYTVTPAGSLALNYATPLTFSAGGAVATQSAALVNPTPGVPTSYAVTAGTLPPGLSLNVATGDITGTPTTPGVYPFTVTASNGTRTATASPTYTVTPAAALSLSYVTPRSFTAGTGIGTQVAILANATPGVPTTYALTGGSLPNGLSLDVATGNITGTPTTPGVFTFTVTATNGGRTASASATYTVVPAGALTLDYTSPQTFPIAEVIATQLPTVTNATPGVPTTFALTAGTLPTGLTLNADGSISGTPTSAGTYPFTVTATNGSRTATSSPTYIVNPPAPQGSYQSVITTVNVPLTLTPENLGGSITTATLASGSLPTGMTLNADGTITGIPTTTGVYPFTVQLCNGVSCMVTALATITVNDLAATPMGATYGNGSGVAGAPLSVPPTVTSGAPVTGATLQGGSLPTGMTLTADGTISGTPTVAGSYTALVTLTNASGGQVTVPVTITISSTGSTPLVATYPLGTGQVGTPLAVSPTPTSGGPVTAATLVGGVLPPGMALNADGSITGTPTQPGSFVAQIQLCNVTGGCTVQAVQIDINASGTPLVTAYTNATGPVGLPLSVTPAVTSGGPVTATTLLSGSVPPGMVLNADGSITGTPTQPGTYTLSLRLCNGAGGCETRPVTLTIHPAAPAASYTDTTTTFGTPATKAPVSTGGPITSASITAGGVAGITIAGNGTIFVASTTAVGTYNLTVRLCNAVSVCVDVPAKVIVDPAAPAASYTDTTTSFGTPATKAPVSTGGPITSASITAGGAAGITVASDGTLSVAGTTAVGTYNLTVRVCNAVNVCVDVPAKVVVNPAAPAASYTDTTTIFGTPATKAPVSTGGPITSASITAGGAVGITVASDGTLSVAGTTAVGTYNLTVRVCNAVNVCVDVPAKVVVNPGAPTSLNYATPVTYTTTVAIANNNPNPAGGAPTAYAVTSGTLPAGLVIDPATGVISGTPTAPTAGAVSITVTGSNAVGGVTQTLSITVLAYPTANLSSNPSTVPVGQSSSLTALFTGSASGTAVLTGDGIPTPLTVTSGTSVPTGIEGIPGTLRTYTLTVTSPQGFTATSQTTVQWVAIPADTWTVTVPTAGGGPLTPGAGNLLNGQISITVPDQGQSLCGAVTLTVNKEAALPGAILSTARDYSHTFNIASNLGYPFRVPITITLTYDPTLDSPNLAATDLPMAFYWDPSYSKWVSTGVKSVDMTAHTVTFTTLLPGRYAVLGIPGLTLATQTLGFASGTDDWRQNNPSVYDLPGGASLGMGSFASWYFPFAKASNGGTGLFNLFPTVGDANAAALISRLGNGTMDSWEAIWNQGAYTLTPKQTGLALVTGLMVTGQPQILLMGDARPAVNTAVATVVYGYNNGTGKFSVLDPNYPGTPLTLTWNSGTGAFSAYDRAAGYSPALAQYAFEGQTSVHRLADYDRVFSGAASGFPPATFATIAITDIAGIASPDLTQDVLVSSNLNVTISGTVTNGDETATHIYWSQNGSAPRVAVPLTGNSFSFTIPALADPYSTTVALETTATPCDPTFSHSGFKKFVVKQSGLSSWFPNMCFESGSTSPWTLQQSFNNGRLYPTDAPAALQANATPTWNAAGEISNYAVTGTWNTGSVDSTLVTPGNDPRVASIPMVLDGGYAFRVNDPSNGAHISRLFQDITVPTTVDRPKLSFYWAAVLEDNGHPASQQPYVEVLVEDLDSIVGGHPEILFYKYFYANDTKYVGWVKGTGLWWGIPWQKVSLNLQGSIRAGHKLRVRVTAADCTQTGHGGVAYIDSIGCN